MRHHQASVFLAGCLLFCSCATIAHGRWQQVPIQTDPPGATVVVDGTPAGVTPMVLRVPRRHRGVDVRLERVGYRPVSITLTPDLSAWVAGDLGLGASQALNQGVKNSEQQAIAGGVMLGLGLGVDVATGAAFTYDPLRVSLKPLPAPAAMAARPVLAPPGVPRSQ
jgi:hypothetical protein